MARAEDEPPLDRELAELPAGLRWREWMRRVEAVLFASAAPVKRADLARVVGRDASVELLVEDLRADYADRAFEIRAAAGGWALRTRPAYSAAIRAAAALRAPATALRRGEALALAAIAYRQPATRADLAEMIGAEVGRDVLARLRERGLIAPGPRSPTRGAAQSYVTTDAFLDHFGLASLADLPDLDAAGAPVRDAAAAPGPEPGDP